MYKKHLYLQVLYDVFCNIFYIIEYLILKLKQVSTLVNTSQATCSKLAHFRFKVITDIAATIRWNKPPIKKTTDWIHLFTCAYLCIFRYP